MLDGGVELLENIGDGPTQVCAADAVPAALLEQARAGFTRLIFAGDNSGTQFKNSLFFAWIMGLDLPPSSMDQLNAAMFSLLKEFEGKVLAVNCRIELRFLYPRHGHINTDRIFAILRNAMNQLRRSTDRENLPKTGKEFFVKVHARLQSSRTRIMFSRLPDDFRVNGWIQPDVYALTNMKNVYSIMRDSAGTVHASARPLPEEEQGLTASPRLLITTKVVGAKLKKKNRNLRLDIQALNAKDALALDPICAQLQLATIFV